MGTVGRPRRKREEIRELLLDAGRSILLEEGLGSGADALTFKHAFERVESETGIRLTNASVIGRAWDNLADYQTDVMVDLASDTSRSYVPEAAELVTGILTESALDTPEERARVLREICRVVGEALSDSLRQSAGWSVWINLWATAVRSELPDRHQRVLARLMDSYDLINEQGEQTFGGLLTILGYRPRPPLTVHQFLNAAGALSEGCSLRDRVDSHMVGIMQPTGLHGEDQPWTVFGIGLHALIREFFEPDPDF